MKSEISPALFSLAPGECLMAVTDDYVLVANYLKAEKEHTYDWLFQMKGFKNLEAQGKKYLRHDAQMNPDPVSSARFVTDCY